MVFSSQAKGKADDLAPGGFLPYSLPVAEARQGAGAETLVITQVGTESRQLRAEPAHSTHTQF